MAEIVITDKILFSIRRKYSNAIQRQQSVVISPSKHLHKKDATDKTKNLQVLVDSEVLVLLVAPFASWLLLHSDLKEISVEQD